MSPQPQGLGDPLLRLGAHVHLCVRVCVHVYVCVCALSVSLFMSVCCTQVCVHAACMHAYVFLCVPMCACVVWTHTCIGLHVCSESSGSRAAPRSKAHDPSLSPPSRGRSPRQMPWPMSHEPHGHTTQSQITEWQLVTSVTNSRSKAPHEPHLLVRGSPVAKAKLKVVWGRKWLGGPCPAGLGKRVSFRPWRGDPWGAATPPTPRSSFTGTGKP